MSVSLPESAAILTLAIDSSTFRKDVRNASHIYNGVVDLTPNSRPWRHEAGGSQGREHRLPATICVRGRMQGPPSSRGRGLDQTECAS
jgi:hypothetical protein